MPERIADIVKVLDRHRIMAVATNRPDGFPQCTMVGYANDGLRIYMIVSPDSQKRANLERDTRVSVAIGADVPDPLTITGVSLAGRAHAVKNPDEIRRVFDLLVQRYPEYMQLPTPKADEAAVYEIRPEVVSLLDYAKGFGHADLIRIPAADWRKLLAERRKAEDKRLPT